MNTRRRNEELLNWLKAALVALSTYAGLMSMSFRPSWGAAALALATGGLFAISFDLGIIAAIAALALPILAANPTVGILFAVLGVVGSRLLGNDQGSVYLLVAGAVAGALLGPVWMVVPLAGYLLGAGEGAFVAAAACVILELLGFTLGASMLADGATIHGGTTTLLSFSRTPETMLSADWVAAAVKAIDTQAVSQLVGALGDLDHGLALVIQPLTWALGAAVTGKLLERVRGRRSLIPLALAVSAGVLVPAAGAIALRGIAVPEGLPASIAPAATGSLLVAIAITFLLHTVFPRETAPAPSPRPATMNMEDADVDELLRLVATAEDRLASQHTTRKVVMITDMKAFSKMTEEDGSIMSAKTIQKHRDLLMPIIDRMGGHGKSTGGDGLVAAFHDAKSAVSAAAQMLQALETHNSAHLSERELAIRIGIAEGEVVLDKGGRPFIGAALNLAARVMNLADGGQAFTTADVAAKAAGVVPVHSHGVFELKNIATPVDVAELLWSDGQTPRGPAGA